MRGAKVKRLKKQWLAMSPEQKQPFTASITEAKYKNKYTASFSETIQLVSKMVFGRKNPEDRKQFTQLLTIDKPKRVKGAASFRKFKRMVA